MALIPIIAASFMLVTAVGVFLAFGSSTLSFITSVVRLPNSEIDSDSDKLLLPLCGAQATTPWHFDAVEAGPSAPSLLHP